MDFNQLILETRKELQERLGKDLTDSCDLACLILKDKLIANNISGSVVNGQVDPLWDTDGLSYGHHFVMVDDMVIDPTGDQFGFNKFFFTIDDELFERYVIKEEIARF